MVEYQRKKNKWNSKCVKEILMPYLSEIKKMVESEIPDSEIAKKYNCNTVTVFKFRKKHNLHRRNLNLTQEKEISNNVLEFILGSVLGDSSLCYRGKSTRFTCSHSIKQKEYIYHIAEILKDLDASVTNSRINTKYPAVNLRTKGTPSLNYLYFSFYKNNKKVIPFELLNNFTARSLAYLFMDDGFPIHNVKNGKVQSIGIALCNFTDEELNKFILFLKNTFDLDFTISKHYNKYYDKYYSDINLKSTSFNHFKALISPYIQTWAYYKIQEVRNSVNLGNSESQSDNPNPSFVEIH